MRSERMRRSDRHKTMARCPGVRVIPRCYAPGARNAPLNAGILPALHPPRRPRIVRAYFQFNQKPSGLGLGTRVSCPLFLPRAAHASSAFTFSSIRNLQARPWERGHPARSSSRAPPTHRPRLLSVQSETFRHAPGNAGILPGLPPVRRPCIVRAYFQFNQKSSRHAPGNAGILPGLPPVRRPCIVRAYFQFNQKPSGTPLGTRASCPVFLPCAAHASSALTFSSIRNLPGTPLGTRASCPLFLPRAAHASSALTSSSIRNLPGSALDPA